MVKLIVAAQSATSNARLSEGRASRSATEDATLKPTITVVGYICHAIGCTDPADRATPQIRLHLTSGLETLLSQSGMLHHQIYLIELHTSTHGFIDDKLSRPGFICFHTPAHRQWGKSREFDVERHEVEDNAPICTNGSIML